MEIQSRVQLVVAIIALLFAASAHAHHIEYNITVPPYEVKDEDAYVCVSGILPPNPHKLIGVIPRARQEVVHHILLYGCAEPHLTPRNSSDVTVWRCDMQPVCNGPSSTVLYGWGRNAPELHLPEGVGFSVGERTGIKYIVAQVHYLALRPPGDHSGVTLLLKPHAVPYAAGLMSYASWFQIPPGKPSHLIQNSCCFKSHQPLTMFAVRVHTHTMGRQVYMTRRAWNGTVGEVLISRDPQLPQSFVPTPRHTLAPGDRLTVTCDFDSSDKTAVVEAGPTHNHEMCNMYVMVYGKTPYMTMCDDDRLDIREDSPGALPRRATLLPDPSPFWQPPRPQGGGSGGSSSSKGGISTAPYGEATGVATGPDGSLWVLYRGSRMWREDTFDPDTNRIKSKAPVPEPVVVQLDPDTGAVLRRWGGGVFYLPHSIAVDVEGNVWVTDVGRHQVLKFTPEGQLLMSVGKELTPGSGSGQFCKPTQVSVLRDGSFLVADGYCNTRAVWFDRQGKYIAESAPLPPVVHSLLADECEGLVYVGSRESAEVRALSLDPKTPLKLKATYDMKAAGHGMVWSLRFGPYGEQLALTWKEGETARLVNVRFPAIFWPLPDSSRLAPHDFLLGAAPLELTGSGDRLFAVYVAPVGAACEGEEEGEEGGPAPGAGCGALRKYVVVPAGWRLPDAASLAAAHAASKEVHPGDAVLLNNTQQQPATTTSSSTSTTVASGGSSSSSSAAAAAAAPSGTKAAGADTATVKGGGTAASKDGAKEEASKEEEEEEEVVNVADDYEEDVAGDVVGAADYEAAVEEKEKREEEEQVEEAEREADYEEAFTGVRPNITSAAVLAAEKAQQAEEEAVQAGEERFEVLMTDKETSKRFTSTKGWALALAAVMAVVMAAAVVHFSRTVMKDFSMPWSRSRRGGAAGGGGGLSGAPTAVASVVPGGAVSKGSGGGGKGRVAAAEVEAARERERLLRSEP
ncbi:hypothetical protein Agub_g14767 [Astrephomene gubernaculifera]|uniref:Peptidylglycine monooxygenase n=1 Tax=Astrephomene gubernaculifera TaxID=47775 RepID=A0AAD3HSJ0_9CHLO|nr:hypothetical protein Agub_g14767 [Astrephomene gubernaculifera]